MTTAPDGSVVPSATPDGWKRVWDQRRLDPERGSTLAQLMAADGLDTGFGDVDEKSWVAFVRRWAVELGITNATSVFEVGCGAGAFLYELHRLGSPVGGIDQSAALVGFAREALVGGHFEVAEAAALDPGDPADVVVSCGVFMYFPSHDYARTVISRMVQKARRAVAILDVPDVATRAAALDRRKAACGGEEAYLARYQGLEHLYYDRTWLAGTMADCGVLEVHVEDQDIAGYSNAPYRFNAWGRVPSGS